MEKFLTYLTKERRESARLVKFGVGEELVFTSEREDLLNMIAEQMLKPEPVAAAAEPTPAETLEIRKREMDLREKELSVQLELINQQKADATLDLCWRLAAQNKDGMFVEDGVLYHRDEVCGHAVRQLCAAHGRRLHEHKWVVCTRWPAVFLLRSLTAKAIRDAFLELFSSCVARNRICRPGD